MVYVEEKKVYLTANQQFFCYINDIPRVIERLKELYDAESVDFDEERYTEEGIDRFFEVPPETPLDRSSWDEDSVHNWENLPGPVLFERYGHYAQIYCEGCRDHKVDPTYQGFRDWLSALKDTSDDFSTASF